MTNKPNKISTNSAQTINTAELIENVAEDNELIPAEKETIIRWPKDRRSENGCAELDSEVAWSYTEEAGIARRLLRNPVFVTKELRVNTDSTWGERIEPESYSEGRITGVGGYLPIGAVKIGSTVRSASGHAEVVAYRTMEKS